jgi:hypothetical protein
LKTVHLDVTDESIELAEQGNARANSPGWMCWNFRDWMLIHNVTTIMNRMDHLDWRYHEIRGGS